MKQRLFFSFIFLGKVAVATLLPLLVFAATGRYIDTKLSTNPWFFIVGALFALLTTILWLRHLSKVMIKKMDKLA